MLQRTRILLLVLSGGALAAAGALLVKREVNQRTLARGGIVHIGRDRTDNPVVSCDEIHLYEGRPVTFLTDPGDPDLDWVVTITDPKGTPFEHGNGKPQSVFTPVSSTSDITARRPQHGKHDKYKYAVDLPQFGTNIDPILIVH